MSKEKIINSCNLLLLQILPRYLGKEIFEQK
jgi:hypothetical protein